MLRGMKRTPKRNDPAPIFKEGLLGPISYGMRTVVFAFGAAVTDLKSRVWATAFYA
jgi:hypothetical protein